ncbi:uncharacterized protein LOC119835300 [Zerene cesonia]|uniref:uncharacterized protein LOC119835300 n=1 Tax=Zerene cesonia TaxID=33412 RepID=UPI0018E570BB|nr:uncharacterized protein LOC119835300 [Zerene cesonia]
MTVSNMMKKINKKIPGILPPPPKSEIDGKIANLSSKTIAELLELRDRQLKLLNNKPFISKLADKGAKIQAFVDKILAELKAKEEEEQTCNLFSNLKLNSIDEKSVQDIEWQGKVEQNKNTYLDSDDDSEPEEVLHILSQRTNEEKKVKVLSPEKPLITPEDLLSIGEVPHVKYIVDKTENKNFKPKPTGQFKPYKTTTSDVHKPEKELQRKKHKHWEVTAATPPPIVHGPAKVLSLEESLKLQQEYNIHLKEIEAMHAAEKLLARASVKMPALPDDTSKFGAYRRTEEQDSDDSGSESDPEGSDKEVHDDEPERGGVIFTVMK